jgi:hypothetical protein
MFSLDELNIEILVDTRPARSIRVPLWNGVALEKTGGIRQGRIIAVHANALCVGGVQVA